MVQIIKVVAARLQLKIMSSPTLQMSRRYKSTPALPCVLSPGWQAHLVRRPAPYKLELRRASVLRTQGRTAARSLCQTCRIAWSWPSAQRFLSSVPPRRASSCLVTALQTQVGLQSYQASGGREAALSSRCARHIALSDLVRAGHGANPVINAALSTDQVCFGH